jgi:hypothetical protein
VVPADKGVIEVPESVATALLPIENVKLPPDKGAVTEGAVKDSPGDETEIVMVGHELNAAGALRTVAVVVSLAGAK